MGLDSFPHFISFTCVITVAIRLFTWLEKREESIGYQNVNSGNQDLSMADDVVDSIADIPMDFLDLL